MKPQPQPEPRWTRNAALARYLNVSNMCLWRWQRDQSLNFPQPSVINNVKYTDFNAIDRWMRERVVDYATKTKKQATQ